MDPYPDTPLPQSSVARTTRRTAIRLGAGGILTLATRRLNPVAAQDAPATPIAGKTTEETLLEVMIPMELLPQGERVTAELDHVTSPPGSTASWQGLNSANWPGLRVHYVLEGTLTVRAEGASQVVRADAGAMPEDVPAGTEVALGPGDSWIARNEIPYEAMNTSEAPTDLLLWVLASVEDPDAFSYVPVPGTWEAHNFVAFPLGVEVPAGPASLRIRRVELPVKGRVPAPPDGLQYGVTLTPVIGPSVGNLPDGRLVNLGRKAATVYVLTLESSAEAAGTPVAGTAEA
jgi:hypothetical protein